MHNGKKGKGGNMKLRIVVCIGALSLCSALAIPAGLAAQDDTPRTGAHHHYKLIVVGTFGGPDSSINYPVFGGNLSRSGIATGWSATPAPTTPTSSFLICGGLDAVIPYITHAFEWSKGAVTDLGSLAGPDYCSTPFWVNSRGVIVGASENGQTDPLLGVNQAQAVLWKDGQIVSLGSLGGYESLATDINQRGQIAGNATNATPDSYCFFGTAQQRAFLWENGQMQDLGTLGGTCVSVGQVEILNDNGQVVGTSTTSTIPNPLTGVPPWDPFVWEQGKGMTDLGSLGGAYGVADSINNRGQIIGQSSIASDPGACDGFPDNGDLNCHAFFWDQGVLTDLTTSTIGGNPQFLTGLNDAGEIIGSGSFPDAASDAFLWRNGVATDLGHLTDCYSGALAINSETQVVGLTISCDGNTNRAFLWENGSMVDLNTLIPQGSSLELAGATGIDDRGEIVGIGVLGNGDSRGFVLIPCDENHPDVEDCEYSLVEVTPESQNSLAITLRTSLNTCGPQ
jgi:probable HAF family extracellular repeat protein